jgi:hypothetical protein
VASATGVKDVQGERLFVHVTVAVPPGQTDRQATDAALADHGARRKRPPGGGGGGGGTPTFAYTGLKWSPPTVIQSYNDDSQPLAARDDLVDTQATWSGVPNSSYRTSGGEQDTTRCPSLVQECRGPQFNDDANDVAWLRLAGGTLGVTWYTISDPEADMALNTRFRWSDTCTDDGTRYDVETVLLHENGHVAGLDHVSRTDSVMHPSYQSARCTLYDYDRAALANLYPAP